MNAVYAFIALGVLVFTLLLAGCGKAGDVYVGTLVDKRGKCAILKAEDGSLFAVRPSEVESAKRGDRVRIIGVRALDQDCKPAILIKPTK